jgi:hypothetical protein
MAERKHAPEAALLHILEEIRQMRRKNMSPGKRRYLKAEDLREQAELSTGIATELADQLSRSTPGGTHAETASGGPLSITK